MGVGKWCMALSAPAGSVRTLLEEGYEKGAGENFWKHKIGNQWMLLICLMGCQWRWRWQAALAVGDSGAVDAGRPRTAQWCRADSVSEQRQGDRQTAHPWSSYCGR